MTPAVMSTKRRQFLKQICTGGIAAPSLPTVGPRAAEAPTPAARTFLSRLQPAVVGGGFELPDYWVWCGAPIRGEDGRYHLYASRVPKEVVFHPHWLLRSEICGEKFAGVHVTSPNGLNWDFARATLAYRREVRWSDARVTRQGFLERPQLLIENGVPTHLFCARALRPLASIRSPPPMCCATTTPCSGACRSPTLLPHIR
jgi:hypothetical protein